MLTLNTFQTLKHFDNVFATGGNNTVEVFEGTFTPCISQTCYAYNRIHPVKIKRRVLLLVFFSVFVLIGHPKRINFA